MQIIKEIYLKLINFDLKAQGSDVPEFYFMSFFEINPASN